MLGYPQYHNRNQKHLASKSFVLLTKCNRFSSIIINLIKQPVCNEAYRLLAFYNSNESSASTHICKLPSRYNLAYSSGSSTASEYPIFLSFNQSLVAKIKKHFNQSTMSLLFYVILFYIIFLVSASLRSVQSGHPLDVLHPCICPYQSS